MVASQLIRVDMEVKQALSIFKVVERESFNEVIKRLLLKIFEQEEEVLDEVEKKAILKAIKEVEKGRTQSFEQMMENIQKKRMASAFITGKKVRRIKKDPGGVKDAVGN